LPEKINKHDKENKLEVVFLDSHTLSLNNDLDFSSIEKICNLKKSGLLNNDSVLDCCMEAEIIIVNKLILDKNIICSLKNLRLICVIATGYNNIDIKVAKEKNIEVVNVPGYAKYSVSQHVFAMVLNLATKICLYNEDVNKGQWEKSKDFGLLKYYTFELAKKTIGIIGFGAIGQNVARIAEGFDMKVMAYDVNSNIKSKYKLYPLNQVLTNADIITLHCPLTDKTRNLINKDTFGLMKHSAVLINTSRGGIVNEEDLLEALNSGRIAGAGIDVLSQEPPSAGNKLLHKAKNLIVTPHTAWSSREARQRMIDITADNINAYLSGKIINSVF